MSNQKLFIPTKCRVGFQHRADTFTNKLAYVIYYDSFGKIRKEKSWATWCHLPGDNASTRWEAGEQVSVEAIEPFDFDNTPQSGFMLNKGIQRHNWSHFGSDRSYIRIYDPRGIEFEITPENLIGLLMHTDCSKREIQGDLVYCWHGQNLMLLPCASEEYEAAKNFTKLQATKIGARELQEGYTYVTKQEEKLIYIGRHPWYEVKWNRSQETRKRTFTKMHIFHALDCEKDHHAYKPIKSVPNTIAAVLDPNPHDSTANLIDGYLASEQSSPIVELKQVPLPADYWDNIKDHRHVNAHIVADASLTELIRRVTQKDQTEVHGQIIHGVCIEKYSKHHSGRRSYSSPSFFDTHHRQGNPSRFAQPPQPFSRTLTKVPDADPEFSFRISSNVYDDGTSNYRHDYEWYPVTPENKPEFFELHAVFENGLERKWS